MSPAFRTVIFDCDSTLSAIEGIEELAVGHRAEVERLTELAMLGSVSLESVYGRRLELIKPSKKALDRIGKLYIDRMVPGAPEVVRTLMAEGVRVFILSGGLLPAVRALGLHLGVPPQNIDAVDIRFDSAGAYAGFDAASVLTRSGGKRRWIEARTDLVPPVLLVGDGATDLEAKPVIDRFAAFTGVVRRQPVVDGADFVIPGPGLDAVLDLARQGRLP
jgi:phosphoserine phosphatase